MVGERRAERGLYYVRREGKGNEELVWCLGTSDAT